MSDPKLRCKYTYEQQFGMPCHVWSCIGAVGAIHLRIRAYALDKEKGLQWSSGIEFHSRTAPPSSPHDAPSQDHCWLLEGPCWHDGSSMYAEERYLPKFLSFPHEHDAMFDALKSEYHRQFMVAEETAQEQ